MTTDQGDHSPGDLLSRLVGDRMYSVEFVLNDCVQLRFDGDPAAGNPVIFNSYVWPIIEQGGNVWREADLGYADALRKLTPGVVTAVTERTGVGIRLELDTGSVVIHPDVSEVHVEIAEIRGFHDQSWMVWRPGEASFEDLV